MRIEYFFAILFNNLNTYILSLIIVIVIYYPILKKTVQSIIDPMFTALIGLIFANSVTLFLLLISKISPILFIHFSLSEIIFWCSFFIFRKSSGTVISNTNINDQKISESLFKIFFALMVMSNLLTYYLLGIPLFMDSRLETYLSGGGIGILSHINNFSTFFCSVYLFHLISNKHKITGIITLLIIILFCILSGSKGSILGIAYSYYIYIYFFKKKTISSKKIMKYIPLIILFPLITISIQNNSGIINSIYALTCRVVSYGDGYFMAYPYNDIDNVHISNPILYLFSGLLGPLRLVDYSSIDSAIGLQLAESIYPDLDKITGPNARLPILNWVLFGWGGLFLCFILGIFFAWIKTHLSRKFPRSIISVIIYGYIYCKSMTLLTDPTLFIGNIFTILVFIGLLWTLFIFLGKTKINIIQTK